MIAWRMGDTFPLTPALSPSAGEREERAPPFGESKSLELADTLQRLLPLHRRGRSEGVV